MRDIWLNTTVAGGEDLIVWLCLSLILNFLISARYQGCISSKCSNSSEQRCLLSTYLLLLALAADIVIPSMVFGAGCPLCSWWGCVRRWAWRRTVLIETGSRNPAFHAWLLRKWLVKASAFKFMALFLSIFQQLSNLATYLWWRSGVNLLLSARWLLGFSNIIIPHHGRQGHRWCIFMLCYTVNWRATAITRLAPPLG